MVTVDYSSIQLGIVIRDHILHLTCLLKIVITDYIRPAGNSHGRLVFQVGMVTGDHILCHSLVCSKWSPETIIHISSAGSSHGGLYLTSQKQSWQTIPLGGNGHQRPYSLPLYSLLEIVTRNYISLPGNSHDRLNLTRQIQSWQTICLGEDSH